MLIWLLQLANWNPEAVSKVLTTPGAKTMSYDDNISQLQFDTSFTNLLKSKYQPFFS
jgi:hypothetical protein